MAKLIAINSRIAIKKLNNLNKALNCALNHFLNP